MCPTRARRMGVLAGALLLAASCATTPKTSTAPPRMKDAASEKVAAQRAAAPHSVQLEQDDERWGSKPRASASASRTKPRRAPRRTSPST